MAVFFRLLYSVDERRHYYLAVASDVWRRPKERDCKRDMRVPNA